MDIPAEFARVVTCSRCTTATSRKLLRDGANNVPQPGFIGANYLRRRVALAGQNPAVGPSRFAARDAFYTAALRDVGDTPTIENMEALNRILLEFIPAWPVHGSYFPLEECGLQLDEIAYFNVVRCRTLGNSAPGTGLVSNCLGHFDRWLELLAPRIVVFIGKWAHDRASHLAERRGIPVAFMNRERSLSQEERYANRKSVVEAVRAAAI